MAQRITERVARSLPSPSTGHKITYDSELKGFGLRVTAKGARAFILNYRSGGQERRLTIGSYPEWSAAAARKQAEELKRQVDLGEDPMARRHEDRASLTVSEVCALYEERHLPRKRPSSQRNDRAMIHTIIIPALGRAKAKSVSYTDVEKLHRDLSRRAPFRANRVVALLSRIFSLAIRWEIVRENPAAKVERNPEQPRARYLDDTELHRLLSALETFEDKRVVNAVRLLALTGARKSEVLSSTWPQFDLERGYWVKPAATVKQARLHRVPLSETTVGLLREMRGSSLSDSFLFPGRVADKPLTEIKKGWARICEIAQLEGVRVHDLRHTYASLLASEGMSLPIIGALLGHTQSQTTQRYAHLLDDPLRAATSRIGKMMSFSKSR